MFDGAAVMMGNYVLKYVHYFQRNVHVGGEWRYTRSPLVCTFDIRLQHNFCPLYLYYIHCARSIRSHTVEQNKDIMNISYVFIFRFLQCLAEIHTHIHPLNVFLTVEKIFYSIFHYARSKLLVVCCVVLCL